MPYSRYNRQRFEGEKPVQEGETYDLEIEATGTKGDGIGKVNGFVVIVPGTKPGQKVKVKIDAVRGKVAFGTVAGASAAKKPAKEKPAKGKEKAEGEQEEESEEEAADEAEGAGEKEEAEEEESEEAEETEEAQEEAEEFE